MTVYRAIGLRVAALRRERHWTQEQLAERAKMSPAYLARIEGGRRRATVEVLSRLAKALDVPLWRLFASSRMTAGERHLERAAGQLADAVEGMGEEELRLLAEVARRMRQR